MFFSGLLGVRKLENGVQSEGSVVNKDNGSSAFLKAGNTRTPPLDYK